MSTHIPSLAGVNACIKFAAPRGQLFMYVKDGEVTLSREGDDADCTITGTADGDLLRLVRGEMNLVTALLQGRIAIDGDIMLAIQIASSMPEVGEAEGAAKGGAP